MSSSEHAHSGGINTYLIIFALLLAFTAVTVAAAFVNFGSFNTVIALVIAFVKATLVMLFFMHLKGSSNLLKVFVIGAFAWVSILIGMTFNDFGTRAWGPQIGTDSWISRSAHHYVDVPPSTAHPAAHH